MASVTQELDTLRNKIADTITSLEIWDTLGDVQKALGLPLESPEGLGKHKYLHKVTEVASDETIINAAKQILVSYPGTRGNPSVSALEEIQDAFWWIENQGIQCISNVIRYEITEALEGARFWERLSLRLTWQMLVDWRSKLKNLDNKSPETRHELGRRLQKSVQSEPERILFDTYFKAFKPKFKDDLPALLPQVYLHYDPRFHSERSEPVLVRQRRDFLMILRNAVRVIIEIDGIHHYAEKNGKASSVRYAKMVVEDRRIKNLGYEVYRFGGAEFLNLEHAYEAIIAFFENLFARYDIRPKL